MTDRIKNQLLTRRELVAKGLSASATSPLLLSAQTLSAAKHAPRRKLGVALCGLGSYSRNWLAPALQDTQHCELRGLITGSPEKIPAWQSRYGIKKANIYSYDNMHEVADNPDIDVVYIVTPTGLHLKYALIAAKAKKHVWCEKPMAMTVKECQTMIDVCREQKVVLSIGYRMQHEPNTLRFGGYAESKPFGALKGIEAKAGYGGSGHPEDYWRMQRHMGGGAMYDMGVYPVNGSRYFSGLDPIAIEARHMKTHPKKFKEVDETTVFTLHFANGLKAECATSVVESYNFAQMNCDKGWYRLEPMSEYRGVTGSSSDGKRYPAITGRHQTLQMDDDALAILQNRRPRAPGEDGLKDIAAVEAAFKSAANKGKKVDIDYG